MLSCSHCLILSQEAQKYLAVLHSWCCLTSLTGNIQDRTLSQYISA